MKAARAGIEIQQCATNASSDQIADDFAAGAGEALTDVLDAM